MNTATYTQPAADALVLGGQLAVGHEGDEVVPGRGDVGHADAERDALHHGDDHGEGSDEDAPPANGEAVANAPEENAADELRKRALRNDFDNLVIVAPPKALGVLRKELHKEVERRVILTINKEMSGRPVPDIEQLLVSETASV